MTCVNISIFFCQIEFVFQPIFVEIPIAAVVVEVSTSPKFETGYLNLYPREKKNATENKSFFFQYEEKKTEQIKILLTCKNKQKTHAGEQKKKLSFRQKEKLIFFISMDTNFVILRGGFKP